MANRLDWTVRDALYADRSVHWLQDDDEPDDDFDEEDGDDDEDGDDEDDGEDEEVWQVAFS